ncbi:hypothetical protein ACRAWG_27800 [Methylobacterium sp. P31]
MVSRGLANVSRSDLARIRRPPAAPARLSALAALLRRLTVLKVTMKEVTKDAY